MPTINHIVYQNLCSQIDQETTVITPNRRLSATLQKLYQQYQISLQKTVWQPPLILPILTWLESLWNEYSSRTHEQLPLLLNPSQEQFVWKDILTHTKKSEHLIKLIETADLIQTARKLLLEWRVDINLPIFKITDDSHALQEWISQYQQMCDEHNWIDITKLPDELLKRDLQLPKKIILFGFTELSPQMQHFFADCQTRGTSLVTIDCVDISDAASSRITLRDQEHELYTMARWAQSIYQHELQNFSASNSAEAINMADQVKIGCVIPNLDKIRNRVVQIFAEVFSNPVSGLSADHEGEMNTTGQQKMLAPHVHPRVARAAYNISAGQKLTQYPIIHAVFQILSLHQKVLSADLLWFLLSTPFIADAETESFRRARFDFMLRQENINHLNITDQNHIELLEKYCPKLAARLIKIRLYLQNTNAIMRHSEWAPYFNTFLTIMGWPGERSLNSEEYQTVENWLKLLNNYILLDQVSKTVTFSQALATLQHMANKHIFQPKTPDAAIQILGLLEAAALPFDHLWIAGMDDMTWPPQPKPNPFIPKKLQRELKMPHATAERELNYCELLTQQFKRSAAQLIFSSALNNNDMELQPSPLIQNIDENNSLLEYTSTENLLLSERIFQTKRIETIHDDVATSLNTEEKVRGGISVLKYQALCPFRAFSECRLHAKDLQLREPGMRAKDRGNIIHKALEIIWEKLKDQAMLTSLDDQQTNLLVNDCIDETFKTLFIFNRFKPRFIDLEKKRLYKLLHEWLSIERKRQPFKVIMTEKSMPVKIGEIELAVKIDRIDELMNGQQLIIDYKTGKQNDINNWFHDRPDEIQLPLYALINPHRTDGITYAQIVPGQCGFKGVSNNTFDDNIKGIKRINTIKQSASTWDAQFLQWQTAFNEIAHDFYSGNAKVNPKDGDKTCVFCKLKPLCRLHEEVNDDCNHAY